MPEKTRPFLYWMLGGLVLFMMGRGLLAFICPSTCKVCKDVGLKASMHTLQLAFDFGHEVGDDGIP
jgi:hypothetical protein